MARAYYFDYVPKPEAFKNGRVEADSAGWAFQECICKVLIEYGLHISNSGPCKEEIYGSNRYRGRILFVSQFYHTEILLTQDNKLFVDFMCNSLISENTNDEIIEDIRKAAVEKYLIDANAEIHESKNSDAYIPAEGGCYVATAVYGSYDCPEVWTLRRFRDYSLARTWYGRAFIKIYYAVSPSLVKYFGDTKWFQHFWKIKLDKLISKLKIKGFKDEPYND